MLLRNLALATTLAVGVPAVAYADSRPVAAETAKTNVVQAPIASSADGSNYAEREKQDKKAASFQGGDVVVVGISGGAILVLLLLLLILA